MYHYKITFELNGKSKSVIQVASSMVEAIRLATVYNGLQGWKVTETSFYSK